MTSRRLIRIKVLQLLYAYSKKESATLAEIERDLLKSMSKSTDLYYETLLLITEVRRKAFQKIDTARNRRFASNVDLNPNTRFIDNPVFNILENNKKCVCVQTYAFFCFILLVLIARRSDTLGRSGRAQ